MKGSFFVFSIFVLAIPLQAQNLRIAQKTFQFYDSARKRPVVTELWYPTNDTLRDSDRKPSLLIRNYTVRNGNPAPGSYPLILISHGSGGGRLSLEWIAQYLASKNYIVAAVDHWGNTYDNPIALEFVKPWERPQDISFALTQLLKTRFSNLINPEKIGAVGYSFGGYAVIALAGGIVNYEKLIEYYTTFGKKEAATPQFPDLWRLLLEPEFRELSSHIPILKDNRIQAFFAICPGTGPGFTDKSQFLQVNGSQVFIVGLEGDSIAPVSNYARNYHKLIDGSTYYEFSGKAGHFVMLGEAAKELQKAESTAFIDPPEVSRQRIHAKVKELLLGFFTRKFSPRL